MRICSLTVVRLLVLVGLLGPVPLLGRPVEPQGVVWETSFEDAKARAQREGKPILLLHLFGRLDDEFC